MPPEDGDGLEPPAADPEFGAREDIVARPQPGFQCGGIGFRQTAPPHLRRRRGVLVVEQMVLDEDSTGGRPKCAEPDARRSIICPHPDNACVVPEATMNLTGEGQTAVPPR